MQEISESLLDHREYVAPYYWESTQRLALEALPFDCQIVTTTRQDVAIMASKRIFVA